MDLFQEEAAVNFIQSLYTDALRFEIKAFKSKAMKELTNLNEQNAIKFATSHDLEAAAEYLNGIKQGSPMFSSYARKLTLPNIPLVSEKLKMLCTG